MSWVIAPAALGIFLMALLAAPLLAGGAAPSVATGYWVWATSLLIVGMPHGAYDIEAIRRDALATGGGHRSLLTHLGVYSVITIGAAVIFLAAPTLSVICFLFLAAHHFGVSDSVWTRGRTPRTPGDHGLGLCHGLIVIATPFVFDPAGAWSPFGRFAAMAGSGWQPGPSVLGSAAAALVVAAWMGLIAALIRDARRLGRAGTSGRAGRAGLVSQLAVMLLVTAISAVAAPLLAIAAYFVIVHATGHCLRARSPGVAGSGPRASVGNLVRVHAASLPLLVPSVAIVWAMTPLFPGAGIVEGLALAFILFCVAGTPPHHLLWLRLIGPARRRSARRVGIGVPVVA